MRKLASTSQRQQTRLRLGEVRTGTRDEWHRVLDGIVAHATAAHIDPDCDLIIDLGCGWGHRMFDMWRMGIGRRARFVGGDRSDYSRRLVEDISQLFPEMKVDWFRFDFATPTGPGRATVCASFVKGTLSKLLTNPNRDISRRWQARVSSGD